MGKSQFVGYSSIYPRFIDRIVVQEGYDYMDKAVEAEFQLLLDEHANVTDLTGYRAVVSNECLPKRQRG
jgi:hypothetical protein